MSIQYTWTNKLIQTHLPSKLFLNDLMCQKSFMLLLQCYCVSGETNTQTCIPSPYFALCALGLQAFWSGWSTVAFQTRKRSDWVWVWQIPATLSAHLWNLRRQASACSFFSNVTNALCFVVDIFNCCNKH